MADTAFQSVSFPLSEAQQFRMHRRGLGKSHGGLFTRIRLLAIVFFAIIWLPVIFPESATKIFGRIACSLGVSCDTVSFLYTVVVLIAFWIALHTLMRRMRSEQSRRVGHIVDWKVSAEADGLRFASRNLEHMLRWPGVHQVLAEREGLIIVHGNSSYFIPREAFLDDDNRKAFFNLLATSIPAEARARSGQALKS